MKEKKLLGTEGEPSKGPVSKVLRQAVPLPFLFISCVSFSFPFQQDGEKNKTEVVERSEKSIVSVACPKTPTQK